jgi:hypothetical protein
MRSIPGGGLQYAPDGAGDLVAIVFDVAVPETQHTIALAMQEGGAARVVFLRIGIGVLRTIKFDHELCAVADEVEDVVTHRRLTAEVMAARAKCAQEEPELALCAGGIGAEAAGAGLE